MSFQVCARNSDGMVISVGPLPDHNFTPGSDFGPDYPIYTIEDDSQYQIILDNPVTYYWDGSIVTKVAI